MQTPAAQMRGAQQSLLLEHAPQVPELHAWLLQSRHDVQGTPASLGGGHSWLALSTARSKWISVGALALKLPAKTEP